ncbi:MAG TPA: hypothetical protein VEX36_02160 [Thermoleophilaceae bacterium]|nr:hypothetical protein [Thermoleophilaceae bacterium]
MGRRSRKRADVGGSAVSDAGQTRAERDAARRARAARMRTGRSGSGRSGAAPAPVRRGSTRPSLDERPPPLWAPFPLTEILVLAGIVLMVWGFLDGGGRDANGKLAAGLAVASIAGLELAIREHVTGFRSHTTLLSGALAIAVIVGLGLGVGVETLGPLLIAAVVTFVASFFGLRQLFKRRSGGAAFR